MSGRSRVKMIKKGSVKDVNLIIDNRSCGDPARQVVKTVMSWVADLKRSKLKEIEDTARFQKQSFSMIKTGLRSTK